MLLPPPDKVFCFEGFIWNIMTHKCERVALYTTQPAVLQVRKGHSHTSLFLGNKPTSSQHPLSGLKCLQKGAQQRPPQVHLAQLGCSLSAQ